MSLIFSISWQIGQVLFVWCFHSFCLYRLFHRKSFSPVLLVIQFLLVLDVIEVTASKPHDILGELYETEMFPWYCVDVLVFILLFRWYSILIMLPIVGVLTIASLASPLFYMHLSRKSTVKAMLLASLFPVGLIIPQYFSCCGFIFYIPGYYFTFDESKASATYYSMLNWVLQVFCLSFSFFSDLYLMYFLYKSHRRDRQSVLVAPNGTNSATQPPSSTFAHKPSNRITPSTRLALSFVVFSCGFVLGTVSYNFLSRLPQSMFITVLKLVFNQSQYIKFGAYAFIPKG